MDEFKKELANTYCPCVRVKFGLFSRNLKTSLKTILKARWR
ncbi:MULTISPECIES: hypothetical protein [unclassified Campylobacter]